jgi:hypothetical protein
LEFVQEFGILFTDLEETARTGRAKPSLNFGLSALNLLGERNGLGEIYA